MSELSDDLVHKGFWINWSHGRVMGSTITTDSRSGNIIIAFVAILTSIATGKLWNLIMFAYHQSRANRDSADGLFHQQQILIRTLPGPGALVIDYIRLAWFWRNTARRAVLRSAILLVAAACFGVAALAAGVFSSYIVTQSSSVEVLVDSSACAALNLTAVAQIANPINFTTAMIGNAEQYAKTCYGSGPVPSQCQSYATARVPFTTTMVPCPFDNSFCVGDDNPAVALDTGLLDSNDIFGINARQKDRVWFRKQTVCAPITIEGHTSIINASDVAEGSIWAVPNDQFAIFSYGETTYPTGFPANMTLHTSLLQANVTHQYTTISGEALSEYPDYPWSSFVPMEGLKQEKADVSLMMIMGNSVMSMTPIDDPVFAAHKALTFPSSVLAQTFYHSDNVAGAISCTQQYQYCIKGQSGSLECTEMQGTVLDNTDDLLPSANPLQKSTINLISQASYLFDMTTPGNTDPPMMQASTSVYGDFVAGLPSNQWMLEVIGWEKFILAGFMQYITGHAIGPKVDDSLKAAPSILNSPGEKLLCQSQKMLKAGGFTNISVFGLSLTIGVSCLIFLAEMSLLKILIFMSRFRAALAPRLDRWVQDGVWQVQRKAFEACQQGSWVRKENDVPLTGKREMLFDLPPSIPPSHQGSFYFQQKGVSTASTFVQGQDDGRVSKASL